MATNEDFIGGAGEEVDYSQPFGPGTTLLPMPDPQDNLDAIAQKMTALSNVVQRGKSLAVATGYKATTHQERDPVERAKRTMKPMELQQYDAWHRGARMPAFDFAANRKEIKGGEESVKRYTRRGHAMARIWSHEGASAENAMWLATEMAWANPLVIAVAKVIGAEKDLVGGQEALSEMELAEVQTARRAVAIATDQMNEINRLLKQKVRTINHAKEIIQAREHALKAKMPNYRKRKDTINGPAARTSLTAASPPAKRPRHGVTLPIQEGDEDMTRPLNQLRSTLNACTATKRPALQQDVAEQGLNQ